MTNLRKTLVAGLAAITLGLGVAATSTPAAAWGWHHGWGFHGWHHNYAWRGYGYRPAYFGGCRVIVRNAWGAVVGVRPCYY